MIFDIGSYIFMRFENMLKVFLINKKKIIIFSGYCRIFSGEKKKQQQKTNKDPVEDVHSM